MFSFLEPHFYFHSVHDIPISFFEENDIKCILFDIDNTLEPYQTNLPSEKTKKLFDTLRENKITIAVISNNHEKRVKDFCEAVDVVYSYDSAKPSPKKINEVVEKLSIENGKVAIIGDQLFTDIWASNNAGVIGIFVDRINSDESFFIKLKRLLEKPVLTKLKKKGYGKIK